MRVLLTGGTGLIGRALGQELVARGHEIHLLTRNPESARTLPYPCRAFKWDATQELPPAESLHGVDAVIHLAGESLIGVRWTEKKKRKAVLSRVNGTENLVRAIGEQINKPSVFISVSAVGYYGDRGDEELTEESSSAIGFLPDLCMRWEDAAQEIQTASPSTRWSILRLGVVLSPEGGALLEVLPLAQDGLLGPVGNGRNWMSWIHLGDLVALMNWVLENESARGIFNAMSPEPATNAQWVDVLNRFYGRRGFLPVPKVALRAVYGEASQVILESQRAHPARLLEMGFQFKYPQLQAAHEDLLPRLSSGERALEWRQWLPAPLSTVFPFFKNPENLSVITPPGFSTQLLIKSTDSLQEGTKLAYKVRVHGVPLRWECEIQNFSENSGFTDVQLQGPFRKWEHTHRFDEFAGGSLVTDRLIFKVPGGLVGRWTGGHLVQRDIERIFKFRQTRLGDYFYGNS